MSPRGRKYDHYIKYHLHLENSGRWKDFQVLVRARESVELSQMNQYARTATNIVQHKGHPSLAVALPHGLKLYPLRDLGIPAYWGQGEEKPVITYLREILVSVDIEMPRQS